MKNTFILLTILFTTQNLTAQDSIKVDRPVILLQGYPDTTTFYIYPNKMIAGISNGLWISVYPIETFPPKVDYIRAVKSVDPNVQYFLKEKNGNAIIVNDSSNKHAFYITPIKKKIKKLKKPVIELEIWVRFNSNNVYFPVRKSPDLYFRDKNGQFIEENLTWKKFDDLEKEDGKILIGTQKFGVKIE